MTSAQSPAEAGTAALRGGNLSAEALAFEEDVRADPQDLGARYRLAAAYRDLCRLGDAEREARAVVAADNRHSKALTLLGLILLESGRAADAVAAHFSALEAEPSNPTVLTNWLSAQQYVPGVNAASLARSHARWSEFQPIPAAPRLPQRPLNGRPLIAGFVSPDLGRHPVGMLSVRLFEHLDHRLVRPVVFSTKPSEYEDDVSRRIAAATQWNSVFGLSDDSLASFIRASKVDVLIDMSGHTAHHRLGVFARRAAPVQASWLGYTGTTGVPAVDYLFLTPELAPAGEERLYREQIIRLPHTHICFEPLVAPPVGSLPAHDNGFITFGCFNNPAKLNAETLRAFAAIMREVPGSRLKLRYRSLADGSLSARLRSILSAEGISGNRVETGEEQDRQAYLASYNDIDIALDSFPFSGCMTTCDALWMGCPVVTFPGATVAGRLSASILTAVGLTDLIAPDQASYGARAVSLTRDLPGLSALRSSLRSRIERSPLYDGAGLAKAFSEALLTLWQHRPAST